MYLSLVIYCISTYRVGLQQHYDSLARNLPDDFATSLDKLQEHLSIEQICCILNCTEPHAANKKLVDCLVEQLHNTERVLDICEWLDKIQGSPGLQKAIEDLRKGIHITLLH